jgi:putative Mg2+ transporter-C (MgtC) family protein
LAVVLGAAIGLEREASGKAAGLRTNVLICLGAAVFTIISRQMGRGGDASMTRIAAQIVTGVGFIGATTAATIWLVASIGMACGAGLHILAVTSTLIAVVVLIGLGKLEKPLARYMRKHKLQKPPREQDSA